CGFPRPVIADAREICLQIERNQVFPGIEGQLPFYPCSYWARQPVLMHTFAAPVVRRPVCVMRAISSGAPRIWSRTKRGHHQQTTNDGEVLFEIDHIAH